MSANSSLVILRRIRSVHGGIVGVFGASFTISFLNVTACTQRTRYVLEQCVSVFILRLTNRICVVFIRTLIAARQTNS